ncbi:cupin domain-containing protein [Hymenobacter sp. H14-R3]|uniref:cupin domain-containing protein n=1 Tax=Hymenobacter sp. H14-R3 TaxID=3046308 RepID=UPI0024B888FC|nr:cupin domain-containing protein [Hymenobacter sp. H14-R3]MDJ0366479.1 cupin domain-containing protein [Hymenobacter sp. H14-R3]
MFPPLKCGSLLDGAHPAAGPQKALVLLKKDGQHIIFKTFEAGETMPTHHHDAGDVLVVVLAGELTITQEEAQVDVQAGDYVIFPAGAPHALACRQAARILIYR